MTRWTKVLSPLPKSNPTVRAGNGTRTRDPNLGKVVLYQLSYSRVRQNLTNSRVLPRASRPRLPPEHCHPTLRMEARGIEPLTS